MNRDPFALLPAADSSGAERDTWAPILPASDPLPEGATADTVLDTLAQAVAEPPRAETPGDALRADVARAALMAREDWLVARLDMARKHRVPVAELDALRAEALRAQRRRHPRAGGRPDHRA